MRGWAVARWVALGLLLVSGVASAHPAGTAVTADDGSSPEVPAQTFDEAFCLPLCETQARQQGNVPPVIVAESGTTLAWRTLDTYHTVLSETETTVDQEHSAVYVSLGEDLDGQPCLDNVPVNNGETSEVLFEIRSDGLYATDHTLTDPAPVKCDEAGAHPDGSYTLKTHCDVHHKYQHQLIHVIPSSPV